MLKHPSELNVCQYPKLVRDYMPEIIKREGGVPHFSEVKNEEFVAAVRLKLEEELYELNHALDRADRMEILEEMADVFEILKTLAYANNIYMSDIEEHRESKAAIKGGFSRGVWMEAVESGEQ